ncbi:MAG: VOC family protein, partial [Gemmatimonadaceae bacterium]|nr:VOC family protein [Gloeobacterales cyanobacterium ES-bin-141]
MLDGFAWAHLYVEDAEYWRTWHEKYLGLGTSGIYRDTDTLSYALQNGAVLFLVSQALTNHSPVAHYLNSHPPGVADIAFRVGNLDTARRHIERAGVHVIPSPLAAGGYTLQSPLGVTHSLIEGFASLPPGYTPLPGRTGPRFDAIDHIVLNVETSALEPVSQWYGRVFGLASNRYFEVRTDSSALKSKVLVNPTETVRLPLNEPLTPNSQIQEFLDVNRGAGVQHIALRTGDILGSVEHLRARGLHFLGVPASYYDCLSGRNDLEGIDPDHLHDLGILVDRDEAGGQLLQIFTKTIFAEPTLFYEVIER